MINQYIAKFSGTGSYLPERIVNNFDLEKKVDTSDEWITKMTGMSERHFAADDEAASDLAYEASKKAIDMAGIRTKDIDMIIVATISGDHPFPSTACILQKKLGLKNFPAFDIGAGCTGFIYASNIAKQFIETGISKNVLVVGVEILSRLLNWDDRSTCVLFGDGAGAAVVSRANNSDISKFIDSELSADGGNGDILYQPAGGSRIPASEESVKENLHTLRMEGNKVFKLAVRSMYNTSNTIMKRNNMDIHSIDWLITHQANIRIIESLGKKLKIDRDKVIVNIEKQANTSAATIPIALDEAVRKGKIRRGDIVLSAAFGAGLTSGSILFRF
ncbi:MAG: beta-ketoacyl-ACP synthase III [Candidatus Cloacimonadota bacterium]|nr:beta-ketoacyl-ACP synthase III [Candidatus Cloacimonadota bacterium]